jgi:hypothetical protein
MSLEYKEGETESERQEKNGLLVEREVLLLFSYPMQTLLEKEILSYEDIENQTLTDEEIISNFDIYSKGENNAEQEIQNIRNRGEDQKEIYEYWCVTEWLFNKLKELKQPVIEWENLNIWGRCCTGQAIALDNIMTEVRKSFN